MIEKNEITNYFKSKFLDGGIKDLIPGCLKISFDDVTLDDSGDHEIDFSVSIADKNGNELIYIVRGSVKEGSSVNIMDIDRAFNITIE